MEKRWKKIGIAVMLYMMVESFAFPEILFPDCIRAKTEQEIETETRQQEKTEERIFEWKFWFW